MPAIISPDLLHEASPRPTMPNQLAFVHDRDAVSRARVFVQILRDQQDGRPGFRAAPAGAGGCIRWRRFDATRGLRCISTSGWRDSSRAMISF